YALLPSSSLPSPPLSLSPLPSTPVLRVRRGLLSYQAALPLHPYGHGCPQPLPPPAPLSGLPRGRLRCRCRQISLLIHPLKSTPAAGPPMADEGPAATAANQDGSSSEEQWQPNHSSERKLRFPRACTSRAAAANRLYQTAAAAPESRRSSGATPAAARREKEEQLQRSKIVTPLVEPPPLAQLPRWSLRSMWEFASLLNFLHVFRPLLNISVEFSVEELETALITPNSTLADIHMPLLKAIPPITRMALGRATWVTVLCRKLKDWWHWVAEGEIPIVASHGTEVDAYRTLEPATRVLILKALCDIRVEVGLGSL
ncbi:hypothetical protein Taro_041889, partial [Colocasia esculenta]|nr:hypothetical protein [Colocasia esculenta]